MENNFTQYKKNNYNPIIDVFSKLSIELHAIIIMLFIICCLNTFNIYRWHHGNVNYAIDREEKNLENIFNTEFRKQKQKRIREYQNILEETSIAIIPFFGMKVFVSDYTLFLIIISYLLLIWLHKRLILLKNLLADYFNYVDSDEVADKTIYSLFSIIFPSFNKPQIYIERVAYVFVIVLYLLLLSNLYEIFYSHRSGKPIIYQDGFYEFLPHILITNTILLFIIYHTHKLILTKKKELIHIRNILLLIRWNDYSFFPGLYEAFENTKPLSINKNYIEYRNYGNSGEMNLVITVQRKDTTFKMVMKERINLIGRYILFSSTYKSQYREKFESSLNKYSGRELTAEEEMMKNFFKEIITDDSNPDHKIPQEYKRIIGTNSDKTLSIENIKELIVKDMIIQALENILNISHKKEHNKVLKLKREFIQLESNYISGLTSLEECRISKNQIIDRILKLITSIEKKK